LGIPEIVVPLSPPVEIQIELKPFESYDLKGFFFYTPSKIFINACTEGDKIGYPKTHDFWVTDFYLGLVYTRLSNIIINMFIKLFRI
jgi:hypothetical protein